MTGASTGFGRATALRLSNLGADVVALCIQEDHLKTLKAENPKIHTVYCDLRNWDETKKIVKTLTPIHLLVNNAGVVQIQPLLEISSNSFDAVFTVNVKAIINVTQVVASDAIERNEKLVIANIASEAGIRPALSLTTYSASKAGVISLTKSTAIELSPKGIRANAVCPGLVDTSMGLNYLNSLGLSNEEIIAKIPIGKRVKIEDVVNSIVFLLSEQSAMITGSILPVEGGILNT